MVTCETDLKQPLKWLKLALSIGFLLTDADSHVDTMRTAH
jgi:hypothetical protein